jgi:hypothetical protein
MSCAFWEGRSRNFDALFQLPDYNSHIVFHKSEACGHLKKENGRVYFWIKGCRMDRFFNLSGFENAVNSWNVLSLHLKNDLYSFYQWGLDNGELDESIPEFEDLVKQDNISLNKNFLKKYP